MRRSTWSWIGGILGLLSWALFVLPASAADGTDVGRKGGIAASTEGETYDGVEYHVGMGDLLRIEVYGEADLTNDVPISAQGSINVPLLGAVQVDGLTPDEVANLLAKLWGSDYLVNPHVAVRVQGYGSKPVQVLGAVHKPGEYYLTGPTNILDILAQAGGIIAEKSAMEIQLKRQGGEATPIKVNLDRLMSTGDGNQDLRAGDVVYVPEGLFVYLMGEVNKAGPVVYYDGVTVARALTTAGGPTTTARLKKVYVIRGRERIRINLKRILQGREDDFPLKPGDQVYIAESVL